MPNGLSGGFRVSKLTLERILDALPADTVVGMTPTRPFASVDVSAVCRMVAAYPDDLIWVEEHDYGSYVIHLEPADTHPPDAGKWIAVLPESPVFEELRRQHVREGN
jgi:hypothetical protein